MTKRGSRNSFVSKYDLQVALGELAAGGHFGAFIDDTGSPGLSNTPSGLHQDRTTWVGVVVPPTEVLTLMQALNNALECLEADLHVKEFHFVDIFSGKGPFRAVSVDERLVIFQLFADILYCHATVYVQTFDPETHQAAVDGWPNLPRIASCFDLHRPKDAALWWLLIRIRDHILEQRVSDEHRAMVLIDEGFMKTDTQIHVDVFDDVFASGRLLFASSASTPVLQLADFAAFCLNRIQLSVRKPTRSSLDVALLRIMEPLVQQFRNCTPKLAWLDQDGPLI